LCYGPAGHTLPESLYDALHTLDGGAGKGGHGELEIGGGADEGLVEGEQGPGLLVDAGHAAGAQHPAVQDGFLDRVVGGLDLPPLVIEGDQAGGGVGGVVGQAGEQPPLADGDRACYRATIASLHIRPALVKFEHRRPISVQVSTQKPRSDWIQLIPLDMAGSTYFD